MKRSALSLVVLLCCSVSSNSDTPKRPPILGIAGVTIAAPSGTGFYWKQLGFQFQGAFCGGPCISHLRVNSHQGIALLDRVPVDIPTLKPVKSYLTQVVFETSDVEALHHHLESRGIDTGGILDPDGANPHFGLDDPEGHLIGFIQFKGGGPYHRSENLPAVFIPDQVSERLIHAGFVVHDRAAMDHFYKDILGFRLYWQGGFKDDQTDWVEMQVPDGTDWIEYMLNIPADADKKELGIQNHFSLGVKDIHTTAKQLRESGITNFDGPEVGRDGKWSLDAYDPDGTRVEFMEFTPVQPPCCHPYTAAHPKP